MGYLDRNWGRSQVMRTEAARCVRYQHTFTSTMSDEHIVVTAVHDYGNIAGCGVRGKLIQEDHRPRQ